MKNMKPLLMIVFLVFYHQSSHSDILSTNQTESRNLNTFSLDEWVVKSNAIGPITIGSSFSSILVHLKPFQLRQIPSHELGFDGEQMMDVYFFNGEIAFALIFSPDGRRLSSMIILHKDLKTAQGLGVGSTASIILKACPDSEFLMNLMSGTEYCESKKCGLTFEFSESVCDYENGEDMPGRPVRTSVKAVRMYINS